MLDGAYFGWKEFEDMYKKSRKQIEENSCCDPIPHVKLTAVYPDNFSVMGVSDAKVMFCYNTLIHIAIEIAKDLNCQHILHNHSFGIGYETEKLDWVASQLQCYIKKSIEENKIPKENQQEYLTRSSHFKFCTVVHGIYISRFLNPIASLVMEKRLEKRTYEKLNLYLPDEKKE